MTKPITFRTATSEEDTIIAQHLYQMWRDHNVSTEFIRRDWLKITTQFIDEARQNLNYQAFIAEFNQQIIRSVGCQIFAGLYPNILVESSRKYGYIWGVYVEPEYRHKGVGKTLTKMAIAHLKQLECTRVILHASPFGKPLDSHLGFVESNEMRLDLV